MCKFILLICWKKLEPNEKKVLDLNKYIYIIYIIKAIKVKVKLLIAKLKFWNANTALKVNVNKDKLVFKGKGLGETKWEGCGWKLK